MGRVRVVNSKGTPVRNDAGVSIIAQPIADDKLLKKTLKVLRKASKSSRIRRGVKEVQKYLRKNVSEENQSLVVLAGNISPIDVISHIPVLCEELNVPYIFVPSKAELGSAGATKRPTSCVLIAPGKEWEHQDLYNEVEKKVKSFATC